VWLKAKNLKLLYSKKISTRREGPFEIMEVMGPVTYHLKLPTQLRIHPVFYTSLLSSFIETEIHGPNFPKLPPDIMDRQEEYEVEAILAHKKNRGIKYLVRWKGYGSLDNTWEPASNLKNTQQILDKYRKTHGL
jgi:hypothetical protein